MKSQYKYNKQYGGFMKSKCRISAFLMLSIFVFPFFGGIVTTSHSFAEKINEDNEVVEFPDPNLQAGIRTELGIGENTPITKGMLKKIKTISPEVCQAHNSSEYGVKVRNLQGIQYCVNLEWLSLVNQRTTDISLLSGLIKLKHLDLRNVSEKSEVITDISALSNLKNLEFLDIRASHPKDFTPLKNLTKLKFLNLFATKADNVDFLENLTELEDLDLNYTNVSDISKLSNLTKLKTLYLGKMSDAQSQDPVKRIKDISALENLTDLRHLDLASNEISDISSLKKLQKLAHLGIQTNKVENFEPLLTLDSLVEVWPQENPTTLVVNKSDFLKAKELFNYLLVDSFSKNDLTKLKEILNEKENVKNYFSKETLEKLSQYVKELETKDTVNNELFNEERENLIKKDVVKVLNPDKISIKLSEYENLKLPSSVNVKAKKSVENVGEFKTDEKDMDHLKVAIVDEKGKLVTEPLKFVVSLSQKVITSENGFLSFDATVAIITWNEVTVKLQSDKYETEKDFSFVRTTANGKIGQINGKDISKFSSKELSKLLVIKLQKKQNAVEEQIDNNSENVNSDAQLFDLKLPVIWNKANLKKEKGTYKLEGELQLPNNLDNSQMLKANIEVQVLEDKNNSDTDKVDVPENKEVLFNIEKTAKIEGKEFGKTDSENLILVVDKIDKNLKGFENKDFELFEIFVKDVKTEKIFKLPNGNYSVTIPKIKGKKVIGVYNADDENNFVTHNFSQDENTLTFETTHLSKYVVEYEVVKSDDIEIKNDKKITETENGYSGRNDKLLKTSIATASFATTLFFGLCSFVILKKK